jgi:hypothetical protein
VPTVPTEVATLARAYTKRNIEILGGIAEGNPDPRVKMEAISMLLDRGWGKVSQEVTHTGAGENGAHEVIIRHIQEGVKAPQK